MKKKVISSVVTVVLSALFISSAFAIPLIGIDTDTFATGRQTYLDVLIGDTFTVDVVVEGIEALNPLAAFQFDIGFDSSILLPLSVVSAGSLPSLVLSSFTLTPEVKFAETSLSFFGPFPSGDFTLASVTFSAVGLGSSFLYLNDTVLSNSLGLEISHTAGHAAVSVVPEPATVLLLGFGLIGLLGRRKWLR